MRLEDVQIHYGQVAFHKAIPADPEKTELKGNVTIRTGGTPAKPHHFAVSFMIQSQFTFESEPVHNTFHFEVLVHEAPVDASYRDIELAAARHLAPMLKAISQQIEEMWPAHESEKSR